MDETEERQQVDPRPTGTRVATNVLEIRKERQLTQEALCERLEKLGRPIPITGITKIEKGTRRVDADELVALALALGTTPNRLLLADTTPEAQTPPGESVPSDVELTPVVRATPQAAWRWASGEMPLPDGALPWPGRPVHYMDFQRQNRPHDSAPLGYEEMVQLRTSLGPLWDTVKATAAEQGVPIKTIASFVLLMADLVRYEERNEGV